MNNNTVEDISLKQITGQQKLWTKPYIMTLISIFIISITMTLFMPLLPIYINMVGGNMSMAGVVVSIYTLAALLSRPFFAVIIDKYGRKPVLLLGFVLIFIGCFAYRFITLVGVLMIFRVIHGVGYSASSNATGTIMSDVVPQVKRSQGAGYYGFVTAASLALGPAFGLAIMKSFDIKTAFTVAAGLSVIGFITSIFISYDKPDQVIHKLSSGYSDQTIELNKKKKINIGYEKSALPASFIMLLIAFSYSGVVTFLAAHMGVLGLEKISLFFIVYALVLLITRVVVDIITKTRSISIVLLPGILSMIVAYFLLATGTELYTFMIAAVLYAIGYGAVQPTLFTIAISACKPRHRGAANSTFFSSMDLGIGLGALIWGVVSQQFNYAAIYFGCIVFMVVSAIAVIVFISKKRK